MKCISQMPPPIANAAVTSQRARRRRVRAARARTVQDRPSSEPTKARTYAAMGFTTPCAK